MRKSLQIILFTVLAISMFASSSLMGDAAEYKYSLWLGGHYNNYEDYGKKIGEFNNIYSDPYPEVKFNLFATGDNYFFDLGGHYYDNKNISGNIAGKYKNRFTANVKYRLFRRQLQTDLLENMDGREETAAGTPGGKMVSHEDLNPGFDYNYDRNMIESDFSFLLSEKHDVKIKAAHRFWNDNGNEQKIANTHCFSCHLTSQAAKLDQTVNQFDIGIEGKPGPIGLSYNFTYSNFKSNADPVSAFYDQAKHPVNGGKAAEFSSRLIYNNQELDYGLYPETQKIGNKFKFFTSKGNHRLSGTATYHKTKNSVTDLETSTYGGALNFSTLLDPKVRLIAKAAVSRVEADDVFVELPLWRYDYEADTAYGGDGGTDFSFMRYSSLDRTNIDGNVEVIFRANPKTTISILGGYEGVTRDDYPEYEADDNSNTLIGQAKIKYREGLKYNLSFKYRLEKTDNPFTNYRGLFEARGREVIDVNSPFYYQREDLKYQDITTKPTIAHAIDAKANLRLNKKASLNASVKFNFDKNDDLDSLTVEKTLFQPALGFTLTPDPKWMFTGGARYQYMKSTGPITVAMFDG